MNVQPTSLSLSAGVLTIEWNDGRKREYGVAELRDACPCATCNTERARIAPDRYEPAATAANLGIRQMLAVGRYAYQICFTDGHDTGFFTIELLRELGREGEEKGEGGRGKAEGGS